MGILRSQALFESLQYYLISPRGRSREGNEKLFYWTLARMFHECFVDGSNKCKRFRIWSLMNPSLRILQDWRHLFFSDQRSLLNFFIEILVSSSSVNIRTQDGLCDDTRDRPVGPFGCSCSRSGFGLHKQIKLTNWSRWGSCWKRWRLMCWIKDG